MRTLLAGLLSFLPVWAVDSPKASEIIAQFNQAYSHFQTLTLDVDWKLEADVAGAGTLEISADRISAWIEPSSGRIRIESKTRGDLTLSDGHFQYAYLKDVEEYTKAKPSALVDLITYKVWHFPEVYQVRSEPNLIGSEGIKVKGKTYQCWVVETSVILGNPKLNHPPGSMRLWIEKDSGLLLRSAIKDDVSGAVSTVSIRVTEFRTNEAIPENTFAFTPSKKATEVTEFRNRKKRSTQ